MKAIIKNFLSLVLMCVLPWQVYAAKRSAYRVPTSGPSLKNQIILDRLDQEIAQWEANPMDMGVKRYEIKKKLQNKLKEQKASIQEILDFQEPELIAIEYEKRKESLGLPASENFIDPKEVVKHLKESISQKTHSDIVKASMEQMASYSNYKEFLEAVKDEIKTGNLTAKSRPRLDSPNRSPAAVFIFIGPIVGLFILIGLIVGSVLMHGWGVFSAYFLGPIIGIMLFTLFLL